MTLRTTLQRAIRPSTTRSTLVLWAKSALNAVLFFSIFMIALPWLAHQLLPMPLPLPSGIRTGLAGVLAFMGIAVWLACLDTFSRHGRGTPLPADAPRRLVTTGLFRRVRNPIMAAELAVIWAEALYLAGLGVTLYAIAMTVTAHWMVVHIEEPELRERFGQSYAEYCQSVPRWLPGPGRRK
ncbi:MAG: isoprenylcysteine carboxylmethyltransferase family protein [Deltaproteobacteria bacterium]|nr:isoprenylcysteine carboxylmethyltransferase family protein [Deltaproteobacteria bacterium]